MNRIRAAVASADKLIWGVVARTSEGYKVQAPFINKHATEDYAEDNCTGCLYKVFRFDKPVKDVRKNIQAWLIDDCEVSEARAASLARAILKDLLTELACTEGVDDNILTHLSSSLAQA